MRPGCQKLLKHRLNKGAPGSGLRFSISFRRAVVPSVQSSNSPAVSNQTAVSSAAVPNGPNSSSTQPPVSKEPIVLVAGDSLNCGLKPHLLGKKKVKVVNISKGGNWINQTEASITKFCNEELDQDHFVEKVFSQLVPMI